MPIDELLLSWRRDLSNADCAIARALNDRAIWDENMVQQLTRGIVERNSGLRNQISALRAADLVEAAEKVARERGAGVLAERDLVVALSATAQQSLMNAAVRADRFVERVIADGEDGDSATSAQRAEPTGPVSAVGHPASAAAALDDQTHDVFLAHASEDKDAVVRPLALALQAHGLTVWVDEYEITVGDSLRRTIDRGLTMSRFGVVVLSPAFFRKEWPQKELDGLSARELDGLEVVLPVWHQLSREDVLARSPLLADRVGVRTSDGIERVADELARAMGRGGSGRSMSVSRARTRSVLRIDYRPRENAFAQEYWADAPHRLFGRGYRVAVTNTGERTLEGVRLLLKKVKEQPYKPIYLRLDGDGPPFTRSLDGVRLDPRGSVLFDVCFRNHENREEIQFLYASTVDPNLRPPRDYSLVLEAQARDVRPRTARFTCFLEGAQLRFRRQT